MEMDEKVNNGEAIIMVHKLRTHHTSNRDRMVIMSILLCHHLLISMMDPELEPETEQGHPPHPQDIPQSQTPQSG